MRTKAVPIIIILLICVALAVGIWTLLSCSQPLSIEKSSVLPDDGNFVWVKPPFIYVNGTLYKHHQIVTNDSLNEHCIFLGEIESSVPSYEVPSGNFQANTPIVGAKLYQSGNNIIVIYNGCYELYRPSK